MYSQVWAGGLTPDPTGLCTNAASPPRIRGTTAYDLAGQERLPPALAGVGGDEHRLTAAGAAKRVERSGAAGPVGQDGLRRVGGRNVEGRPDDPPRPAAVDGQRREGGPLNGGQGEPAESGREHDTRELGAGHDSAVAPGPGESVRVDLRRRTAAGNGAGGVRSAGHGAGRERPGGERAQREGGGPAPRSQVRSGEVCRWRVPPARCRLGTCEHFDTDGSLSPRRRPSPACALAPRLPHARPAGRRRRRRPTGPGLALRAPRHHLSLPPGGPPCRRRHHRARLPGGDIPATIERMRNVNGRPGARSSSTTHTSPPRRTWPSTRPRTGASSLAGRLAYGGSDDGIRFGFICRPRPGLDRPVPVRHPSFPRR